MQTKEKLCVEKNKFQKLCFSKELEKMGIKLDPNEFDVREDTNGGTVFTPKGKILIAAVYGYSKLQIFINADEYKSKNIQQYFNDKDWYVGIIHPAINSEQNTWRKFEAQDQFDVIYEYSCILKKYYNVAIKCVKNCEECPCNHKCILNGGGIERIKITSIMDIKNEFYDVLKAEVENRYGLFVRSLVVNASEDSRFIIQPFSPKECEVRLVVPWRFDAAINFLSSARFDAIINGIEFYAEREYVIDDDYFVPSAIEEIPTNDPFEFLKNFWRANSYVQKWKRYSLDVIEITEITEWQSDDELNSFIKSLSLQEQED